MEPTESEFLRILTDKANEMSVARAELPNGDDKEDQYLGEAFNYCINNIPAVAPTWYAKSRKNTASRIRLRRQRADRVERNLAKRFSKPLLTWKSALAGGELINRELNTSFVKWLVDNGGSKAYTRLFGIEGAVGGQAVKTLILIGMHARMLIVSEEIRMLLSKGFSDGALSRMRTLYETTVKAIFICSKEPVPGGFELAERYYVTARMELTNTEKGDLDEVDRTISREATLRWGDHFFKCEHNWAAPGLSNPNVRRVTFRDIEQAVELDHLRDLYIKCNTAVHAGSLNVLTSTDFRRAHLHDTRPSVQTLDTAYIGRAASYFLRLGTIAIVECVAKEMCDWDAMLTTGTFTEDIEATMQEFKKWWDGQGQIHEAPSGE